ncbi:hypothetical protein FA13DRAFT_1794641 [Coprinellus micaceus]|uniref:DNA 3'-5' helicase n=1 Tax=Coprinellus micaceus TaxID=71717 RepID=A0A4Y7T0L8_COPMI|nr:hypothetical protein FA13DRAFT_1794641 [Coprinellus micaceus]
MSSAMPIDFLSTQGRVLVTQIHIFQLDGIANSMAGKDVLATVATGAGKIGFCTLLMILIKAIAAKPSLWPGVTFPKRPVMIVILPTKALQQDMRRSMTGIALVNPICPPAQEEKISERVVRFGVDEVHLINAWGKAFRGAFMQIGFMRVRLPTQPNQKFTPLIATSAKIRPGEPLENICRVLGLQDGSHHLIRRSNLRRDIQTIVREMQSGIGGSSFPELNWLLDATGNTVGFAKTISLGFRIGAYLWKLGLSRELPDLPDRIRLFNSANWPSYNTEALGFLNNPKATITIATDVLGVGWDSQYTQNCVVFGDPPDIDDFLQKIGRVGRNRENVSNPRAFLYHTKGALIEPPDANTNRSMSDFLAASCYLKAIDLAYANPEIDPMCLCGRCLDLPPATHTEACNRSRCRPEDLAALQVVRPAVQRARAKPGEGISKEMQAVGMLKFSNLRMELYLASDDDEIGFLTPQAILPNNFALSVIKAIYSIASTAGIAEIAQKRDLKTLTTNSGHLQVIYDAMLSLKEEFQTMRAAKSAARKARKTAPKGSTDHAAIEGDDGEGDEGEDDLESDFVVTSENTTRTHASLVITPASNPTQSVQLEGERDQERVIV